MEDETPKKKSLSEISHLFLSSVRDNATGGLRPKRLPPGTSRPEETAKPAHPDVHQTPKSEVPPVPEHPMNRNVSLDMTPEEFEQVFGGGAAGGKQTMDNNFRKPRRSIRAERTSPAVGPISAIIGAHLNGTLRDRARQYARHLCSGGERVALMEVDGVECRVTCFDAESGEPVDGAEPLHTADAREMVQALDELAWDIDRWVLLLPAPREPEARTLLQRVEHWVLLSTTDHDGVVSCYRSIKGLVDLGKPRLTLALLDAADAGEAARVHRKIAGVCEQFLGRPVQAEPPVEPVDDVAETPVLICRPDRAKLAGPMQWDVIAEFLDRARVAEPAASIEDKDVFDEAPAAKTMWVADVVMPAAEPMPVAPTADVPSIDAPRSVLHAPMHDVMPPVGPIVSAEKPAVMPTLAVAPVVPPIESDVIDLPTGEVTEATVLSAVLGQSKDGLVACPVRAPMCPHAVLAVGRDRRLLLLAASRQGLGELRSIAQAYRWVIENRPLLSMALPQFSIDTMALPALRLLVDHADVSAELLQPMLQTGNVSVQTYRKLRWAGKTGLLLEAA